MCVDWLFARAKNLSSFSPALKSSSNPTGPLPLRFFWPQLTRLFEIYPQLLSPASSPPDWLLALFQPHRILNHVLSSPMALALHLGEWPWTWWDFTVGNRIKLRMGGAGENLINKVCVPKRHLIKEALIWQSGIWDGDWDMAAGTIWSLDSA